MQHSVKQIGDNHEQLSRLRKENPQFNSEDFFNFAKENKKAYSIIDTGHDLLVSTWHSDSLVKDYEQTI